jgi:hypothetical protein
VALRSPLSGAPPSALGGDGGGASLPSPLSPPPTPAAMQQAALQAALLARHRQLLAQARPARNPLLCSLPDADSRSALMQPQMHPGGAGSQYPAHWSAQLRAAGIAPPGAYGGLGMGGGGMMSLLGGGAQQRSSGPTPTQQRGAGPGGGRGKVTRTPTAYNLHMRAELKRLKQEQPALEHKDAWRLASGSVRPSIA